MIESPLKDEDKFPGDSYTCDETVIDISIERSRQRGLTKRFKELKIDWEMVDSHLKGLGALFSKGRKITFSMEVIYKEVTSDSTTARGKKKKKSVVVTTGPVFQARVRSGVNKVGESPKDVPLDICPVDAIRRSPTVDEGRE